MTEATNNLREAENAVFIEGAVSEIDMDIKEINGQTAIAGSIAIQTDENSIHEVNAFSFEKKKDGGENQVFKGLQTVMDEYNSIAQVGKEKADKVRVTNGQLRVDDYYNPAGELKSIVKVQTNFVNRLRSTDDFNPKADFEIETYIYNIRDEVNPKENEPTGRKIIEGLVPMYGGTIKPINFVVEDQEYIDAVESMYEPGHTVKIFGEVINKVETKTKVKQVAIGKPKEIVSELTTRELLFTGGSEPYDDETGAFSTENVKKAMQVREEMLEELKKKQEEKKSNNSGGSSAGTPKKSGKDLPF